MATATTYLPAKSFSERIDPPMACAVNAEVTIAVKILTAKIPTMCHIKSITRATPLLGGVSHVISIVIPHQKESIIPLP